MTQSQSASAAPSAPVVTLVKSALSGSGASVVFSASSRESAPPTKESSAPTIAQVSTGSASNVVPLPTTAHTQFSLDWPLYLAWGITVIGWLVTHSLTERREQRKERRTEVDACCKIAAELLVKARIYYAEIGSSEKAKLLASEIRFEAQRLFKRVERLQEFCPSFQMEPALDALMDSVIGGDFDSIERPALVLSSPRLNEIEQACHLVMDSLEDGFSKTYHDNWLRRAGRWLGIVH